MKYNKQMIDTYVMIDYLDINNIYNIIAINFSIKY